MLVLISSRIHAICLLSRLQDSLKSGVHLDGGRLELLEIIKLRVEKTDHAFLSACRTGVGDEKLSDDVVHLAAGMLAVGYRGVVAKYGLDRDMYPYL